MNREVRERIVQEMASGQLRTLGPDDTFKFACTACGSCCFDIDVMLNPMDVYMMARSKMARNTYKVLWTRDLFAKGLIESYRGEDSRAPLCIIRFMRQAPGAVEHCPFLTPSRPDQDMSPLRTIRSRRDVLIQNAKGVKYVCGLHEEGLKPMICRLSPLGRGWNMDPETRKMSDPIVFWQPIQHCPGLKSDRVQVVKDYFEKARITGLAKYSDWWYQITMDEYLKDFKEMDSLSSHDLGLIMFDLDYVVLRERHNMPETSMPDLESVRPMARDLLSGKVPTQELGMDEYFELLKERVKAFMDHWRAHKAEIAEANIKRLEDLKALAEEYDRVFKTGKG